MTDSGYKSLYSVFIFLLAFSIINFYAKKVKEEKRFKLENLKIKDLKAMEKVKETEEVKPIWNDVLKCYDDRQMSCNILDIFLSYN